MKPTKTFKMNHFKMHFISFALFCFSIPLHSQNNNIEVDNINNNSTIEIKGDNDYNHGQIKVNQTDSAEGTPRQGVTIDGGEEFGGGQINLFNSSSYPTLQIDAQGGDNQSFIELKNTLLNRTILLRSEISTPSNRHGALYLYNENNRLGTRIDGGEGTGGGQMNIYNSLNTSTIQIDAEGGVFSNGDVGSSFLGLYSGIDGYTTVAINGQASADRGGRLILRSLNDVTTVLLESEEGAGNGSVLKLYNNLGQRTIELDAESGAGGDALLDVVGKIVVTGSDFAERFVVNTKISKKEMPGMLLVLDDNNPGQLKISTHSYDKKIAGIVSGAGGITSGLVMGEPNTIADGEIPVAISGRVYCYADATNSAIQIGDFLTTSSVEGHAMKAKKIRKSQGAIIGKAMTSLAKGEKGLVLVLINSQ